MLSIEPSKNAENALRYFRESLSVGDYYSENQQIIGQWQGKAASTLGLNGPVDATDFEKLLNNIHPQTGKRLTARQSKNRRPMYDFTFNAPKSVSLIHAITGDSDILKAHQYAVQQAMAEVEANMQTQAGSGKAKHYATTGNALWAEFVHQTTRPVKQADDQQFAPDPHLHSHCAVINATHCPKQQRFKAIEVGTIKAQGDYYEALYHSHLAYHLKRSGYRLKRAGKRWEIAGIERSLIEKFSSRTLEIDAFAIAHNITSQKAKARLGKRTRKDKASSVPDGLLHDFWMEHLSDKDYAAIVSAKNNTGHWGDAGESPPAASNPQHNPMQAISAKRLIDLAIDHCFTRVSGIAEKKLLAFALDQSLGEVTPQAIQDNLQQRDNILFKVQRSIKYITTTEVHAEEEQLIDLANAAKNCCPALDEDYSIQDQRLNAGQRAAVQHVLNSHDKIMIVSGDAGVGKTTLLQEVNAAVCAKGKQLFAFAPSSDAARNVLRSKGFDGADTIAALLVSEEKQQQLQDQVLLIDEAGMIGVPTMNRLLKIAKQYNARLILSGDWKQHSAVERGDALKIIENICNLPVARVTEIVRQQQAKTYQKIIGRIARAIGCKHNPKARQKIVAESVAALDKAGSLIEIDDNTQRYEAIPNDYLKASEQGHEDVLVVAPTHAEGREVTKNIRRVLQDHHRLSQEHRPVKQLINKHYTAAQKTIASSYSVGDAVECHQNVPGLKAGQRYRVIGFDQKNTPLVSGSDGIAKPLLPTYAERWSVYEQSSLDLAIGDRIRITKNIKSLTGSRLLNGHIDTVTGFDEAGNIQLASGAILSKDSGHLHYGYVTTSYAAQGRDAKTVLIAQSSLSLGAVDDKQFYVSVSRGHEHCRIYTDDKTDFIHAVSQNGDRLSAHEIAAEREKVEAAWEEEDNRWLDFRDWLIEFYEGIKCLFNGKASADDNAFTDRTMEYSEPTIEHQCQPT